MPSEHDARQPVVRHQLQVALSNHPSAAWLSNYGTQATRAEAEAIEADVRANNQFGYVQFRIVEVRR